MAAMGGRVLTIELPADLPNDRYATITHAMFSVLVAAGIADESSVRVDATATDVDLNAEFDRFSAQYPWGL